MEANKHLTELNNAISMNDLKSFEELSAKLGREAAGVLQQEVAPHGTSLHLAAKSSTPEVIKAILSTGVDVNVKQSGHVLSGLTPLHTAVFAGNRENMVCLLDHEAELHAMDSDGLTPLHYACQDPSKMDIVRRLVKEGGDVNRKDHSGSTPLQVSVLRSSAEMTNFLIEQGADLYVLDTEGQGLLHYAAEWANIDLAKMLLERGADVNMQDNMGRTPLHIATEGEVRNLMIEHGADVRLRDKKGRPAVEGHIDRESKENKRLEAMLGDKLQSMKRNEGQPLFFNASKAQEVQKEIGKRIPKTDPSRSQVMSELLSKVKPCDDDDDDENDDYN